MNPIKIFPSIFGKWYPILGKYAFIFISKRKPSIFAQYFEVKSKDRNINYLEISIRMPTKALILLNILLIIVFYLYLAFVILHPFKKLI